MDPDELFEDLPGKEFRLQRNRFHGTWHGFSGSDSERALLNFIRNSLSNSQLKTYSIVSDYTEKDGDHLHGYFSFEKRTDVKNIDRVTFNSVAPNIRYVKTDIHEANIIAYHKKKQESPTTNYILSAKSPASTWSGGRKSATTFRERCQSQYGGSVSEMIKSDGLSAADSKKLTKSMMSATVKFPEPDIFPFDVPIFRTLREMMLNIFNDQESIYWLYDRNERSDFLNFTKYAKRYLPYTLVLPIASEADIAKKIYAYTSEGIEFTNFIFFATAETRIPDEFYDVIKKLNAGLLVTPNLGSAVIDISSPNVYVLSGHNLKYECRWHRWFNYQVTEDGITLLDPKSEKYKKYMLPDEK